MSGYNYTAMSEEEVQKAREFALLPDGIYDFAVMEAKFKYSKNSNPMIELKLRITHDGEEYYVFDNLIAMKSMMWKTKHFCDTTGLQKEYLASEFNEHLCPNKRGTCAITNVAAVPKNNGKYNADGTPEMYKAKNEVQDYLSSEAMEKVAKENPFSPPPPKVAPAPAAEAEEFLNDEIPF